MLKQETQSRLELWLTPALGSKFLHKTITATTVIYTPQRYDLNSIIQIKSEEILKYFWQFGFLCIFAPC